MPSTFSPVRHSLYFLPKKFRGGNLLKTNRRYYMDSNETPTTKDTDMKTRTRIRKFILDHRTDIIVGGFYIGCAIGLVYIVKNAKDSDAEFARQLKEFIIEENRHGRTVFELADGTYLSVTVPE